MSAVSEFRSQRPKRRITIDVPLPNSTLTIECRRPELMVLAMTGWLKWPALQAVQAVMFPEAVGGKTEDADAQAIAQTLRASVVAQAQAVGDVIDDWVCAAAVSPRIVLTEAEADENILWIEELDLDQKLTIFAATIKKAAVPEVARVAEFRRDEPDGATPRSDSAPVPDPALVAAGD